MDHHDPLGIVGTTIEDKYEIEAVVGEGGFGIVYRAMHKIWKQPVAIKCFKVLMEVAPAVREGLLKDFIQEGALLTQLSGRTASIVQARDVGTFTTREGAWVPYMVLEWLDGMTLEAMLDAERARLGHVGGAAWPLQKAIPFLEPVAMALDVVHRRGIAHRDIKPANIFVLGAETDEMHVKVLDFGIAKVVQSAAEHGSFTRTGGHVTSFTPAYGAPEQFSRAQGATGPWTDVYALALIMTELLIGRPPLEGDDFIQLGMATANPSQRPTPATLGLALDPAVEAIFQKALAVKPADRFATAGEFWQAVRASQHLPALGGTLNPAGARSWVDPSPASRAATTGPGRTATAAAGATELAVSQPIAGSTMPIGGPGSSPNAGSRSKVGLVVGGVVAAVVLTGAAVFGLRGSQPGSATATVASSPGLSVSAPSAVAALSAAGAVAAPRACPDDMARIAGGKFFMGSDDKDADPDERPAHQVTLSPYCIDLHEVTAAQYKACSDIGECKRAPFEVDWKDVTATEKKVFSAVCNANQPDRGDHPSNCVDWDMAATYCAHAKKRLPTEAEWDSPPAVPTGAGIRGATRSPTKPG